MSLSHEQRYLLEELREYLKRVEKMVSRYDIDLNNIASEYAATGFHVAPKIPESDRSMYRRDVFSQAFNQDKIHSWLPEEDH